MGIGGGAMLGPSSVKARSSSLTFLRYACLTWKGRNALLKPARTICLMSGSVSPICVWQSQSSFDTVVSVTSRHSYESAGPRFKRYSGELVES